MKKDKLYIVNKFNKKNLFAIGGLRNEALTYKHTNPWAFADDEDLIQQYMQMDAYKQGRNALGITRQANPLSRMNIGNTMKAAAPIVGQLGNTLLSGGLHSGAGSVLSGLGAAASAIPGLEYAGMGLQLASGAMNALIGTSTDTAQKAANDEATSAYANYKSNASSTDDIQSITSQANLRNPYKSGILNGGWADRNFAIDKRRFTEAKDFAQRSQANNANNILQDQISSGLATYAAYGGPLDMINNDNMGAIEYGFMSDWLANKKAKEERLEEKQDNNVLMGEPLSTMFAEGGKIEIKHPGRLTELKKRTGKTEAELYNDGNPAHKKMVVFARNSRRWSKHALGGYLKGNVYDIPEEEINRLIAAGYEVEYL